MKACCNTVKARRSVIGTVVSGIGLILLPKCPLCLIGYSAVFASLGLSAGDLSWARAALWGVLGLSLLSWIGPWNREPSPDLTQDRS